jgi:hypothetical protein
MCKTALQLSRFHEDFALVPWMLLVRPAIASTVTGGIMWWRPRYGFWGIHSCAQYCDVRAKSVEQGIRKLYGADGNYRYELL